MSAIWGIVDLNIDKTIDDSTVKTYASDMKKGYEGCVIDRFSETFFDRGFFSCGIQFFSQKAENEQLPIKDTDNKCVFTADIVLNGKQKLIEEITENYEKLLEQNIVWLLLGIGHASTAEVIEHALQNAADGTLSYLAWLIWKEKLVDHIIGMFAIAVYDIASNEFYLFADHMGTRCIYYSLVDGKVAFSTLTKPIISAMKEHDYSLNEKWIVACEATSGPDMCMYEKETPYEEIFQLCGGMYIKISKDNYSKGQKVAEIEYWNPIELPIFKESQGIDYCNLFRRTFFDCVGDAIDTDKNIAATISSGLDSTSVAGVAAIKLARQNRKLYGFTQVPLKDYESSYDEREVTDESEGVKTVLKRYENIEHCFDDYEGKSVFTELQRIVKISEVPVKAMANLVWIDDILAKAREKHCKVLLIGQFGNGTISRGNILTRVYQELIKLNWGQAKRQLAAHGVRYGVPRKILFNAVANELICKTAFDLGINKEFNKDLDGKYLKKCLIADYDIKRVVKNNAKKYGCNFFVTRWQQNSFILSKTVAQNISIYETKLSLYHGVIIKDPTRDKRIIELVVKMPDREFCDDGLERRLVRKYLFDIVPDEIRNDPMHRGRQGADAVLRMQRYRKEMMNNSLCDDIWKYLNRKKVEELFAKGMIDEENSLDIAKILTLNCFLEQKK